MAIYPAPAAVAELQQADVSGQRQQPSLRGEPKQSSHHPLADIMYVSVFNGSVVAVVVYVLVWWQL